MLQGFPIRRAARATAVTAAALGVLIAGGLVAYAASGKANPPAPGFSFSRSPASRTITQGGSTTYTVTLTRDPGFTADVTFQASGLPSGVSGSFSPPLLSGAAATSTLTVSASATSATGAFSFTIVGTSGSISHSRPESLTIAPPLGFGIAGSALGLLYPGRQAPLDLTLTNPYGFALNVVKITVHLNGTDTAGCVVSGPRKSFTLTQIPSAAYPIRVSAGSSATLSQLGLAIVSQPQLAMLDTAFNQDACRGASINLSYTGSSKRAPH
jgi:hypothetical protein